MYVSYYESKCLIVVELKQEQQNSPCSSVSATQAPTQSLGLIGSTKRIVRKRTSFGGFKLRIMNY